MRILTTSRFAAVGVGSLLLGASLSPVRAQTYYTSGTTAISTSTLTGDTVVSGDSSAPAGITIGTGATVTLGNGTAAANLVIGIDGEPILPVTTGIVQMSGGTLNVVGSGSTAPGTSIAVGYAGGTGTFELSGGTIDLGSATSSTALTTLAVGTDGGVGTFTQTGGQVLLGTNFAIGTTGTGSYTINAGTLGGNQLGYSRITYIGDNGGTGTFNIGGTANVSFGGNDVILLGGDHLGVAGSTGIITQTGGTFSFDGQILGIGGQVGDSGTYQLNGGVFEIGGAKLVKSSGSASLEMGGGTLRVTGTSLQTGVGVVLTDNTSSVIDAGEYSARFDGGINGSGDLRTDTDHEIRVSGASSVGALTVGSGTFTSGGQLSVESVIVESGASLYLEEAGNVATTSVQVDSGGVLVGAMAADEAMQISSGGIHDLERASQSTLSEDSTYVLGGTLKFDLGGGGFTDARIAANSITLLDGANIVLYSTGALPAYLTEISLFDANFLSAAEGIQFSGEGSLSAYVFTFNEATGSITVAAVPEPSTVALLALAAGGVLWVRRRSASRA